MRRSSLTRVGKPGENRLSSTMHSQSTDATRPVSPATPEADGPLRERVPGSVRTPPAANAIRWMLLPMRDVPACHWAARSDALWPVDSRLDPLNGWSGGHHRRRDTCAALAVLMVIAASAGIELSLVTVSPPAPRGAGTQYVSRTLTALETLVQDVRPTRGGNAWGKLVGTITVAVSGLGTGLFTARPHLHMVCASALVPSIREWWSAAAADLGLPDGPDAVHAEALGTTAADCAAVSLYLGQADWTRPTSSAAQPLLAAGRMAAVAASAGTAWGVRARRQWRATARAVWHSGVALGLVTSRALVSDGRDVATAVGVAQLTASADMEPLASAILGLRPYMRTATDLGGALQRYREEHVDTDLVSQRELSVHPAVASTPIPGETWGNSPRPFEVHPRAGQFARTGIAALMVVAISAGRKLNTVFQHFRGFVLRRVQLVAPASRRERCVHPTEASAQNVRAPRRNGLDPNEVRPRARSPPTTTRPEGRPQAPGGHAVLTMD